MKYKCISKDWGFSLKFCVDAYFCAGKTLRADLPKKLFTVLNKQNSSQIYLIIVRCLNSLYIKKYCK